MCEMSKSQRAAHVMTAKHARAHYISRTSDNYFVDFQLSHYDIDGFLFAQFLGPNEIQYISVPFEYFVAKNRLFAAIIFERKN